ncbi:MAG TPA: hypothetical protein PLT92_14285 [Ignavibacteriaceae bacterium]|nr:hypothetical protein [Ignavibacteriaceae bacterium]
MDSKHCEWCGKLSANYFYRFIAKLNNLIFLDSPYVREVDISNTTVYLKNGEHVKYSSHMTHDLAASHNQFIQHIFCSERCEDDFIDVHKLIYRQDLKLKSAFITFSDKTDFHPFLVAISSFDHEQSRCIQCNSLFPDNERKFGVFNIISKKIEYHPISFIPDTNIYEMIFTDIKPGKTSCNYYMYKLDMNNSSNSNIHFCSNECVFDFSSENSCFILSLNNVLGGIYAAITPDTLEYNKALGNVYKYRPKKIE